MVHNTVYPLSYLVCSLVAHRELKSKGQTKQNAEKSVLKSKSREPGECLSMLLWQLHSLCMY